MALLRLGPCGSPRLGGRLPHRGETERQPKGEDAGGTPALPGGVLPFVDNLFDFGCHRPPIKNSSIRLLVFIRVHSWFVVPLRGHLPLPDLWRNPLEPSPTPWWPFVVLRGPSWIILFLLPRSFSDFPRTPWSRSPPTADPSGPVPGWEFARSNAPAPRPPAESETARRPPDTTPG